MSISFASSCVFCHCCFEMFSSSSHFVICEFVESALDNILRTSDLSAPHEKTLRYGKLKFGSQNGQQVSKHGSSSDVWRSLASKLTDAIHERAHHIITIKVGNLFRERETAQLFCCCLQFVFTLLAAQVLQDVLLDVNHSSGGSLDFGFMKSWGFIPPPRFPSFHQELNASPRS